MLARLSRAAAPTRLRCAPVSVARRLCSAVPSAAAPDSAAPAESSDADAATKLFAPDYSRAARRSRLLEALDACRLGHPFEIPKPQPRDNPGACGAVINAIKASGPMKTQPLFDAVEAAYPGLLKSKTFLKKEILEKALVNQLMKVRVDGSSFKDSWAIRRSGQVRMRIARDPRWRRSGTSTRGAKKGGDRSMRTAHPRSPKPNPVAKPKQAKG